MMRYSVFAVFLLAGAAFTLSRPEGDNAQKVRYYVQIGHETEIWLWLPGQLSERHYKIRRSPKKINGKSETTYYLSALEKFGRYHELEFELPQEIRQTIIRSFKLPEGPRNDRALIDSLIVRIQRRQLAAEDFMPISPRTIYYFWHTDSLCKIWLGGLNESIFYLSTRPAVELRLKQEPRAVSIPDSIIQTNLSLWMDTKQKSGNEILNELANHLYNDRPNDIFIKPIKPNAICYFQKVDARNVKVLLLSSDSSYIQSVLFRLPSGKNLWEKDANIESQYLGIDPADKKPFLSSNYPVNLSDSKKWPEVWHDWVNGGLSLEQRNLKQEDQIYKNKHGNYCWMWLQLIDRQNFNSPLLPQMPPKPTRQEESKKVDENGQSGDLVSVVLIIAAAAFGFGLFVGRRAFSLKVRPQNTSTEQAGIVEETNRELSAQLKNREKHISSIEHEAQALRAQIKNDVAELQAAKANLEEERKKTKSLQKSVDDLGVQKSKIERDLNDEKSKLKETGNALVAAQKDISSLQKEKVGLIEGHKKQIVEIKESAINETKATYKAEVENLNSRLNELKTQSVGQQNTHQSKIAEMTRIHQVDLSNLRTEHENKTKEFNAQLMNQSKTHQKEQEDQKAKYKSEMETLRTQHQKAQEDQKNKYTSEIDKLKTQHKQEIKQKDSEFETSRQRLTDQENYINGYHSWNSEIAKLRHLVERATFNLHDRNANAAGHVLAFLNYSIFELLQAVVSDDAEYKNKRLAMIANVQIFAEGIAQKYPEFDRVLAFMQNSQIFDFRQPSAGIEVVDQLPDKHANIFYRQLFRQLLERTRVPFPKLYFSFQAQQNGETRNLILLVESSR